MEKLMGAKQVMEIIGESLSKTRQLMMQMHPIDVSLDPSGQRHTYKVRPSELEAWLERRAVEPAAEAPKPRQHRKPIPAMPYADEYGRALIMRNGKLVPRPMPPTNEKRLPRRATATKEVM